MHRLKALIILISAALALPGITSCEKSGVEAAGESPLTDAQIRSLDAALPNAVTRVHSLLCRNGNGVIGGRIANGRSSRQRVQDAFSILSPSAQKNPLRKTSRRGFRERET